MNAATRRRHNHTGSIMSIQSVRPRNKSLGGTISPLKNVPSLGQLISEGRASDERIRANEQVRRRSTKATLIEWLDQARRLWMANDTG